MDEIKHKGTEFSNIKEAWEHNERVGRGEEPLNTVGTEFSNVEAVWEENEERKRKDTGRGEEPERETLGDDYWERIAEDPASGYKNDEEEEVDEEAWLPEGDEEEEKRGKKTR